jgi:hypothetical protein
MNLQQQTPPGRHGARPVQDSIDGSVWLLAQAHRYSGEFEAAEEVGRRALELLKPRRAEKLAIPFQPCRGRHLIEVARAYHLAADYRAMLGTLDAAYRAAPETIRYNGYARGIIADFASGGPAALQGDARDLAERVGVLA